MEGINTTLEYECSKQAAYYSTSWLTIQDSPLYPTHYAQGK